MLLGVKGMFCRMNCQVTRTFEMKHENITRLHTPWNISNMKEKDKRVV